MKKNHYLSYGDVQSWRERLGGSPTDGHPNPDDWQGFEVYGSLPSPPCVKIAAYLRWKRLPFLWRPALDMDFKMMFDEPRFAHIKERIMPIVVFPDGRSMNDSTFILRAIEERYPERSVLPSNEDDPGVRFVGQLLEDFADEWVVRCVYGFRWNDPDVRDFSGKFIALSFAGGGGRSEGVAKMIVPRQLDTSNRADAFVEGAYTDDIIYHTFHEVADAMERHFSKGMRADYFMLGDAPTNVDFAFYGMFYQFIQDRIPAKMMVDRYPSVTAWTHRMNDTSGYEKGEPKMTDLALELLQIASKSYLPFLSVNAKRLREDPENDEIVDVQIFADNEERGILHAQRPYPYQAKCREWLIEDLEEALSSANREKVDELRGTLDETGCLAQLQ